MGSLNLMTKLVLWPVVDNTPLRSEVLYNGASYTLAGFSSFACIGMSHTMGNSVNRILGSDSQRTPCAASKAQPWGKQGDGREGRDKARHRAHRAVGEWVHRRRSNEQ